jgi:cytosine deaminase
VIGQVAESVTRVVQCEGRVVTPGLVDAHVHLDKALLLDRAPGVDGTLEEALRVTADAKRGFTRDDIANRARRVLDMALRHGTTAMRSHVEVDPIVGLSGLDALLALKREYAPALDLQLCAFAQEGIVQAPGTEALLDQALAAGADLVGGCPYNDTDPKAHVDIVFGLAKAHDVDVDLHADFSDEPRHQYLARIAEETLRHGWQGRVAVGHATEMAALPPDEQERLAARLAAAGVAVILLPATDLYLMGRKDLRNPRRGLAPARRLLRAGVTVAAATNNVQNAFTPVGNASLALQGYLLAVAAHMGGAGDAADALAMLTTHPARILGLDGYGIAPGCRADLVVWDALHVREVIATLPACRFVVKGGRVTVEQERRVREPWRETVSEPRPHSAGT